MSKYIIACVFLALSFSAQAHHSMAHFEDAVTEMEGVLVDLHWRNPHIYFFVETEEPNGEKKVWELEAGTIYMVGRAGVTRDLFTVGDRVRIAGNKSTLYDDKFWVENILTAEGKEVLVVANGQPLWSEEIIGGRAQWTNEAFVGDESRAVSRGSGLFRVWSPATRNFRTNLDGPATTNLNNIATEAAYAKAEAEGWDPYAFDDACEIPGLPRVNFGPHPVEFIQDGENILLLNEEFYVTRTIHMNPDADPSQQPFAPLGYSVGQWQDENTLLVETSRINYPYLNLGGVGQSEQVTISEKYVVNEGEDRLDYQIIIRDPVMLSSDYVRRGVMLDIGEVLDGSFDCIPKTALDD